MTPTAFGDVVDERRSPRQVGVDRLARRLQPPREAGRQRGDSAAVAARRFGRRRSVEHGLAFGDVGHAMSGERRSEPAIIVATIHIDQASPVEYRDFARLVFVASEQRPQAAVAVAVQDLGEQGATDERRMAALAAEGRIDDRRIARRRGAQDPRDRRRAQQRHVDRRQQERVGVLRQRGDARPTLENMPAAKSGSCARVTPSRVSSGARSSASKPVTTWMRSTPAARRLATHGRPASARRTAAAA